MRGGAAAGGVGSRKASEPEDTQGEPETGNVSQGGFQSELIGKTLQLSEGIFFLDFLMEEGTSVPGEGAIVLFYPRGNTSGGAFVLGIEDGPKYIVTIDRVTGLIKFEGYE
jgi:hypothetical protein